MKSICLYFQVHQPFRLRPYRFFDLSVNHCYFDEDRNRSILKRVAEKCYLPMNAVLIGLMRRYGKDFKISFSVSGMALEQIRIYVPEVLESFQHLAATGCVEFLAETYAHSLSALKSTDEFRTQVNMQRALVRELFQQDPVTFRNTELIYSDSIGAMVAELGFKCLLTEGARHILGWKSPNYLYCNAINPKLKILLKNFRLSDDIAFRFSQQSWDGWPLTAEKYVDWLNQIQPVPETINLFMDYETFGEHQWPETGIFEFMKALPGRVFSHSDFRFCTPSEVSALLQPKAALHVPHPISWADEERNLTAWLGNELQDDSFQTLYEMEDRVKKCGDERLLGDWRMLQTSDHFYYMCTKFFNDGDVHKYFNPYVNPYEAYVNYMNVMADVLIRLEEAETALASQPVTPEPRILKYKPAGPRKKVSKKPRTIRKQQVRRVAALPPARKSNERKPVSPSPVREIQESVF